MSQHNDQGHEADGLITIAEARELLGVSKAKIAQLIKSGVLEVVGRDLLDQRVKLVRRADVEALRDQSHTRGKEADAA
jgi:hypothetical protein